MMGTAMKGTAFVNNYAPETVQLRSGKQIPFRSKKELFFDAETIAELRFLESCNAHIFEAGEMTMEELADERMQHALKQKEGHIRAMAMKRPEEKKPAQPASPHLRIATFTGINGSPETVKVAKPNRAEQLAQHQRSAAAMLKRGEITEAEFSRHDLAIRSALDEIESGIPPIEFNGAEYGAEELLLHIETLKSK